MKRKTVNYKMSYAELRERGFNEIADQVLLRRNLTIEKHRNRIPVGQIKHQIPPHKRFLNPYTTQNEQDTLLPISNP